MPQGVRLSWRLLKTGPPAAPKKQLRKTCGKGCFLVQKEGVAELHF